MKLTRLLLVSEPSVPRAGVDLGWGPMGDLIRLASFKKVWSLPYWEVCLVHVNTATTIVRRRRAISSTAIQSEEQREYFQYTIHQRAILAVRCSSLDACHSSFELCFECIEGLHDLLQTETPVKSNRLSLVSLNSPIVECRRLIS